MGGKVFRRKGSRTGRHARRGRIAVAVAATATIAAATALSSATAQDGSADTVFVNGRVLLFPDNPPAGDLHPLMTPDVDWAQAVAVTDGLISYVGDDAGAQAHVGPDTEVVDLQNKMLMPGLGDGHLHGQTPPQCDLHYEGGTVETVLGKLEECLLREDQLPHLNSNFRLTASLFMGEGMQPPGTRLDRHILDRLSKASSEDEFGTGTTRPIIVRHMDGHKLYTNTKAIENAGLDASTPDPPDGFIGRDPDGYPNGQFADFGANWGPSLPPPPDSTYNGRVQNIEFSNSLGITAWLRPGGGTNDLLLAKRLADEGKLNVHLNQALSAGSVRGEDDPSALQTTIDNFNASRDQYDGYSNPASPGTITVDSVKIFCDGVPEFPGQTASMLDPYRINVGTPENPQWVPGDWRGEEPSCEDARPGFIALDRAKWSIHCHCLGDRATRVTLNNLEAAMDENATWDRRHTLTHLQFVDEHDLDRFGELGVVANFQAQLFQRDAWSVEGIEGYIAPERMDNLYPAKDLIDGGAVASFGIDWPVTALKPWAALEQAVTREGQVSPAHAIYPGQLNADDAITLGQAYKASTIGVAYQMHMDDVTGSIEVGKMADLIVVDRDPYNPPGGEAEALATAEAELAKAQGDVGTAEAKLVKAKADQDAADRALAAAEADIDAAKAKLSKAKAKLKEARADDKGVGSAKKAVKRARRALKRAKQDRDAAAVAAADAAKSVADAEQAVADAKNAVTSAEQLVAQRQQTFDAAQTDAIKDISNTQVLMTMVVGKTVYAAPGNALGVGTP
jgi:predicted amidohydrolase YtcJ